MIFLRLFAVGNDAPQRLGDFRIDFVSWNTADGLEDARVVAQRDRPEPRSVKLPVPVEQALEVVFGEKKGGSAVVELLFE